jgi:hypothetical protein
VQQQMACPHEAMPVSKLESGTSSQLAPDVRIGSLADGVKTVRHFRPSAGTHEGRFFASIGVIRSYNGAKPDAVWRPKQAVHIGVRAGPPRQH